MKTQKPHPHVGAGSKTRSSRSSIEAIARPRSRIGCGRRAGGQWRRCGCDGPSAYARSSPNSTPGCGWPFASGWASLPFSCGTLRRSWHGFSPWPVWQRSSSPSFDRSGDQTVDHQSAGEAGTSTSRRIRAQCGSIEFFGVNDAHLVAKRREGIEPATSDPGDEGGRQRRRSAGAKLVTGADSSAGSPGVSRHGFSSRRLDNLQSEQSDSAGNR